RRLLENGANTSFVNRIADSTIAVESVVADPVAAAQSHATAANPKIPLPRDLYGDRVNSAGFVFADEAACAPVLAKIASFAAQPLARIADATAADAQHALAIASKTVVANAGERAAILDRAADLLEANGAEFMALLAREAGKTLPDGLGEVREAADFCRYYAMLARRHFAQPEELTGPT